MDLRNTQIALPLEIPKKEFSAQVRQHWNITFARQKKVSVFAKRIMAKVISQIKKDEMEFRPYYQMYITDVCPPGMDISSAYKELKKAFDQLTDLKWLIEDLESERFYYRHLINTSDANCGYDSGTITIVLNPLLKPYFVELAHYTEYEVKHYMHFSSWYSMRLFELLSAFRDSGRWEPYIEDYRRYMDCEGKLKNTSDLIKKTLAEPLEELENTPLAFTYELVYGSPPGKKGRPSIIQIKFQLKKVVPKQIPEAWYAYSDEHKRILFRLLDFKVTESNITKYAPAIGFKGISDLIRSWEIKMNTAKPIQDKQKYCNAAFVRAAKAALEEKAL